MANNASIHAVLSQIVVALDAVIPLNSDRVNNTSKKELWRRKQKSQIAHLYVICGRQT